jgi:hypothetical protein
VSALIAGLFSLAISVSASDLEEKAGRYVSEQFGRVGRTAPQLDPKLSAAARSLAKKALERGVAEAVKMPSVSEAVSKAEGSDPSPRAFATRDWRGARQRPRSDRRAAFGSKGGVEALPAIFRQTSHCRFVRQVAHSSHDPQGVRHPA